MTTRARTVCGWLVVVSAAAGLTAPSAATAQTASRVIRQIDERCANCHRGAGADAATTGVRAPDQAILRRLPAETILRAITTGPMRVHAEGVPDDVKRAMAEFLSGRKLGSPDAGDARAMPNRCTAKPPLGDVSRPGGWNGWGAGLDNARFAADGGLTAADVPTLTLKWAFGFPNASSIYGQPTAVGGRVFVAADTGWVYALDAATGCVHWSFLAETGVRNAVSVAPLPGAAGRHAVYFGDIRANVYAIDADSGDLLWKEQVDEHPLAAITGSPVFHDGRLFVPLSSREEAAGGSPNYPCCTFRGSVVALEAGSGRRLWKGFAIPEPPVPSRRNSVGTQLWTGAGAAIWHAPTIDSRGRTLYLATGDAYTNPAHRNTDAVMAMDLDTGAIRWAVQDFANDAWLVGCAQQATENCPTPLGPDYDFGSPPILHRLPDGSRVLLAGQKSGLVFAHDPDQQGRLRWTAPLVDKVGESEILFGGAADGRAAYFALDNGTVAALDPATGRRLWFLPPRPPGPHRGVTAALTAIPGAVFVAGQDGTLRAHAAEDGRVLWSVDTQRDFDTVNRVPARGGSMGGPGPTVSGGWLFVPSGYVGLGNGTPGNVLLAYGLP